MKIKEVEERLCISSYTLRYYEKMGLIKPFRDENGYRNYSDNDLKVLKKIRFLRELEVPIEDIQLIIEEKTTFQNVLDDHMKKIDTQMKYLQHIKDICEDLKERKMPLLETMIDEKIIYEENINQEKTKESIRKLFDYFKSIKTVVIGCRVGLKDYIAFLPLAMIFSLFFGAMTGIGIPNLISYMNQSLAHTPEKIHIPIFKPSLIICVIASIIIFIIFSLGIAWYNSKQDYIEFLDNYISICSYKYQSRLDILKSIITKKENPNNKHYHWDELNYVEIQLYFTTMSGGRGIWTVYVPVFIFYFKDGFQYDISSGLSFGEDSKTAYYILKSKNIDILADEHIIDYFEQDEMSGYDYFENIYHKNSKKR